MFLFFSAVLLVSHDRACLELYCRSLLKTCINLFYSGGSSLFLFLPCFAISYVVFVCFCAAFVCLFHVVLSLLSCVCSCVPFESCWHCLYIYVVMRNIGSSAWQSCSIEDCAGRVSYFRRIRQPWDATAATMSCLQRRLQSS